MRPAQTRFRLLIFLSTLLFIGLGTYLVIRYAKGDRLGQSGIVKGTGLLSANSFPTGAEVYINGKLTTATDNTLNLDPGEYQLEIKKDGYHTWNKRLTITKELVTQTNARLFPVSPTLEPLTYTGAINAIPSPDGTSLAYVVASASAATKNGLYIQDLDSSPISLNKSARQISREGGGYSYANSHYTWSPNGSEILVAFENGDHLLLDSTRFNDPTELKDVTVRLPQILSEWELELARTDLTRLTKLPDFFQGLATESSILTNLYFSPDGEKLLYQALSNLEIPIGLIPSLPSSSSQPETRQLSPGNWYVYDLKEDKNFLIAEGSAPSPSPSQTPKTKSNLVQLSPVLQKTTLLSNLEPLPAELISSPSAFHTLQQDGNLTNTLARFNAQYSSMTVGSLQWYPDSIHLIITTEQNIVLIEYDSTNATTVYAGPFDHTFVTPWPDYSKIVTRIQFSPDTPPNLYTIKLR